MLTAEQLQEIKERAAETLPRYDANFTYHSQLDVMPLVAEVERLRAALEKIAYTPAFKSQAEIEAFADKILRGESS